MIYILAIALLLTGWKSVAMVRQDGIRSTIRYSIAALGAGLLASILQKTGADKRKKGQLRNERLQQVENFCCLYLCDIPACQQRHRTSAARPEA